MDGNFALMRNEAINFKVEKSSKNWLSTGVSGEGLLQTFEGSGFVWIAPTQGVYDNLAHRNLTEMFNQKGVSNTRTK